MPIGQVSSSHEVYSVRYFGSNQVLGALVFWQWSNVFTYKLVANVLMYYLFVFTIMGAAILIRRHPLGRSIVQRRIWVSSKNVEIIK